MKTEFDTSNEAWEVYKLLYEANFHDGIELKQNKRRRFIEERITVNNRTSAKPINFSGDTDFNYTKGFAHSRLTAYRKYLKDGKIPGKYAKIYSNNLTIFEELTYSIVNVSLIPQNGNMQAIKQGVGNDRLDTFIWALDEYYNKTSNVLFNHSSANNMPVLKEYLAMYQDVYEYCATVYHINESLVDELIESGKRAVDSPERVIEFMNLTYRFWTQKAKFLRAQADVKKNTAVIEMLDEISEKLNLLFAGE
ncbi:MAG: hypothetical protein SOY46_07295 [Butyrivibrio crossotus]|nr:hypothetical protein [Butyrivibrio crossotus]